MRKKHPLELLPTSHRSAIQNIRNFLAGRLLGATRDRALMDELFKCVFAKHWLLKSPNMAVSGDVSKSYRASFAHVKNVLPGIFLLADEIELDPVSLQYVDRQFDIIDLEKCRADIFSELYEAFAGAGVKASEGQFFTPTVAVDLLVSLVNPKPKQTICDPACGAGGFLIAAAKHLVGIGAATSDVAASLRGVDKDAYLARITRGRLALYLDKMPEVICGDSLADISQDGIAIEPKLFDVVLTNPPFGAKIVAASPKTLMRYDLARKWIKADGTKEAFVPNGAMNPSTPPQVLFVERCLKLVKPGGFLGAILPESIVSSKSHAYVVQYMQRVADLVAVVGMPEALFKTSGKGGTHTKTVAVVLQKKPSKSKRSSVFFADAKWCGHDSRGRSVPLNHVPQIAANFAKFRKKGVVNHGHMGIAVSTDRLGLNLAPRAFEFDAESESDRLTDTHDIVSFGDLIKDGVLSLSTGDEVGKLAYGTGKIPFVRTSDISNWEVKSDPKHCVSEEIYEHYRPRQDVQENDILMVKDGTYLIGTCAVVTEYDLPMLYQSHIYKIRVEKPEKMTPFLLLAALTCPFAQRQIKSFCVSQDIIDSLGNKIHEIRLALPKAKKTRDRIATLVEKAIRDRTEARELARKACEEVMAG
jgi:type I restriction enzyme M protein